MTENEFNSTQFHPKQEAFRRILDMAHRPDLASDPFTYLMLSDGSVVVTRGGKEFLKRHFCEQLPGMSLDLQTLPLTLPTDYELPGITGAVVKKEFATKLHDLMLKAFPEELPM